MISNDRLSRDVLDVWQRTDAACFDVDSTVIREEGLDGLAEYLCKGEEVRAITQQTMGGRLSFREALTKRLDIIQPTLPTLLEYSQKRAFTLTPGIRDLVAKLQAKRVPVYLVSGGFLRLILPVARSLGIPASHVFCNRLLFDDNGKYTGFDHAAFTSDSGGKGRVIEQLITVHSYQNVVMIGDGATDMEASPPAHAFVGFGGNVIRPAVQKEAKCFVTDFTRLHEALE